MCRRFRRSARSASTREGTGLCGFSEHVEWRWRRSSRDCTRRRLLLVYAVGLLSSIVECRADSSGGCQEDGGCDSGGAAERGAQGSQGGDPPSETEQESELGVHLARGLFVDSI